MTDIESLAASLVREYLSRKGLKTTLQALDVEMPRAANSISNRAQLAKEMHIEKLMKRNKDTQPEPLRTMLEVLVKYTRDRGDSSTAGQQSKNTTASVTSSSGQSARDRRRQASVKSQHNLDTADDKLLNDKDLTSERQDYDDLLKSLEKSKSAEFLNKDTTATLRKTKIKETKKFPTQRSLKSNSESLDNGYKELLIQDDTGSSLINSRADSVSDATGINNDRNVGRPLNPKTDALLQHNTDLRTTKTKPKKGRALSGPIMSSGFASVRAGVGRSRHAERGVGLGQRLSHSLTLNEGGLFDDEEPGDVKISESDVLSRLKPVEFEERSLGFSKSSQPVKRDDKRSTNVPSKRVAKPKVDDLLFEDVDDDLDQELGQLSLGPARNIAADFESKPISLETAMALKNLIFGTATSSFNVEWRNQSFTFCDLYNLEYGIVQLKGGPCGELAAVQSFVMKHLLFMGDNRRTVDKKRLQPSSMERTKALVSALAEILWRAGSHKGAVVVSPTGGSNFVGAGRYKPDQLTETLVLNTFKTSESLKNFLSQNIRQFESESSSGCILFLYSVILSRTVKRVVGDMDEPSNTLMGAHGYCTQEMVNLILTGKATSNVFDGVMDLDSGGATKSVLRGVDKQGDVGLLSLFEHYGSCQVGVNLKTPKYPIWVICSESHFSVLFSIEKNLLKDRRLEKKFDLYYYDGLARQDEEIKLTVDTTRECSEYKDGDLVPPLELCIRTRWKKSVVDWNGSEPIL